MTPFYLLFVMARNLASHLGSFFVGSSANAKWIEIFLKAMYKFAFLKVL